MEIPNPKKNMAQSYKTTFLCLELTKSKKENSRENKSRKNP